MSEHYYSRNPNIESNPQHFKFQLRGYQFQFKTDQGVFSKNEVDFGSRVLIESFEAPKVDGPILDVGCGYGPIGLSIAKSNPERNVHMVDVNGRALLLSRDNAVSNQVANVTVYESDALEGVQEKNFAAILTNPPIRAGKDVVHAILSKSYEHLAEKGELWVVIQKKQGAPSAMKKLEEVFHNVEVVLKKKGYYILKSVK
ncbi:16S rRNA (guanine1207-N2)-methyltransferase [Bacillus pakistanensis]|uniref:16S rRNA (Guanine1207-N2)-methyltransferase n=1 Tax=Rossellomorea pakistanensis TaxID=992288 RepID=A0ABS2NKC1_9BACI|nr:class I SAM-dependent methyltransferase [Bacillus pakistanensis]MBM7588315.1 16S rRNA (guanine1207-N2)-methyltransferase [Bacillus pakistanensis]